MNHTIRLHFYSHKKLGFDADGHCSDMSNIGRIMLGNVTVKDVKKYHVRIYKYETLIEDETLINDKIYAYLEGLFMRFNSEDNPLSASEYQKKIKKFLSHTSMSVGDVVQIDDDYYVVAGVGFKKLKK